MQMYGNLKQIVVDLVGLSPEALHIVGGFIAFLIFWAATRSRWRAFTILALLQIFNELLDMIDNVSSGRPPDVPDAMFDTAITLALPLVVAAILKLR